MTQETKHCSDCKHFEYNAQTAHQNRCTKFGGSQPVAVVRTAEGPCKDGEGWEQLHVWQVGAQ